MTASPKSWAPPSCGNATLHASNETDMLMSETIGFIKTGAAFLMALTSQAAPRFRERTSSWRRQSSRLPIGAVCSEGLRPSGLCL
jgi:hypothetical protein